MLIIEKKYPNFGNGPTEELCHTALTVLYVKYTINFSEQQKKFCLSFHYNGANSYLFVNGVEVYKLKSKDSEKTQLHYIWMILEKNFQLIV